MHWILGIGLTIAVFIALKTWSQLPENKKKTYLFRGVAGSFVLLILMLLLTGRIHILVAAVAALLPFLRKLPVLLKYVPLVSRLYRDYRKDGQQQAGGEQQGSSERQGSGAAPGVQQMSAEEARKILGVDEQATRESIVAAHRRLIQKVHPDRGGSDFLAAQINEAKFTLLGDRRNA